LSDNRWPDFKPAGHARALGGSGTQVFCRDAHVIAIVDVGRASPLEKSPCAEYRFSTSNLDLLSQDWLETWL
jgi:hypothetical protein